MPAFSRTITPRHASWPSMPTGLVSTSRSGKVQRRTTMQVGRSWTESYAPALASNATYRGFIAQVEAYYNQQTALTVTHPSITALLGAGGGTPLVNGGSQSGSSLITDGWPATTTVLRMGDNFLVAGSTLVRTIIADALTNGSGQVTLSFNPPIYAGNSPSDNAALTITPASVLFTAFIASYSEAAADEDSFYKALTIVFQELP